MSRPEPSSCFLGVGRSLGGKRWQGRAVDDRLALALTQRLGLPDLVGRLLAARGVALETAESFLDPRLRDQLPDPSRLKDMDLAVRRLVAAIEQGEQVAVFGDYDVDGATSAALLQRFFRQIGCALRVYVPDRLSEGYGPNTPALRRLKAEGMSLVVTVDCGVLAFDALEAAAEAGLDVIVVDHHTAEERLPRAVAVVNPNRLDDSSGQGQLAAVGVAYLLLVALNRALREAGWYETAGRREPDLLSLLDLVALGTVCDVVPLTGLNRAFVAQGLKVLGERRNSGLVALADVAGIEERPGTFHCGFLLGPRVNAGGRVGEAGLGAELLGSDDPIAARQLAGRLDAYNAERRAIEAEVLDAALAQLETLHRNEPPRGLVVAAGEGWHPGVIGIVASRLKDRFGLPALVVAMREGVGKASGRSVRGVDLGSTVIAARQAGLLIDGGGHAMAAGMTLSVEALPALRDFLQERLARRIAELGYRATLQIDAALQPGAATAELVALLERVGPFGVGNPEPRFALPAVRVQRPQVVGESHVRCLLQGADGQRLKAIAFKAMDGPLGPHLLQSGGVPLHAVGKLRRDSWAGVDKVQLIVEDVAPVAG